ncbi:MAG: hypothetical protein ABW136_00020, partial [Steroidobacteraceae bacterium]
MHRIEGIVPCGIGSGSASRLVFVSLGLATRLALGDLIATAIRFDLLRRSDQAAVSLLRNAVLREDRVDFGVSIDGKLEGLAETERDTGTDCEQEHCVNGTFHGSRRSAICASVAVGHAHATQRAC